MRLLKTKEDIIKKRIDIENQLNELINSMDLNINFNEIKEMIYNENDQRTLHEIMVKFDKGQNVDELNNILATVNDAWNYFPHKVLNGLSPAEKILKK